MLFDYKEHNLLGVLWQRFEKIWIIFCTEKLRCSLSSVFSAVHVTLQNFSKVSQKSFKISVLSRTDFWYWSNAQVNLQ